MASYGVQACRLPALKPLKPLKPLKTLLKGLKPLQPVMGVQACLGMLHPAANRHPKATHQWLLMGVQACRLPALKPLKPLKTLQTLKTLKTLKTLTWHASSCRGTPRPAINGFLWAQSMALWAA